MLCGSGSDPHSPISQGFSLQEAPFQSDPNFPALTVGEIPTLGQRPRAGVERGQDRALDIRNEGLARACHYVHLVEDIVGACPVGIPAQRLPIRAVVLQYLASLYCRSPSVAAEKFAQPLLDLRIGTPLLLDHLLAPLLHGLNTVLEGEVCFLLVAGIVGTLGLHIAQDLLIRLTSEGVGRFH